MSNSSTPRGQPVTAGIIFMYYLGLPGFPPLWILLNGLVTGWAGHSTLFVLERVWPAGLGGAELCFVSGWKSSVTFAKMGG